MKKIIFSFLMCAGTMVSLNAQTYTPQQQVTNNSFETWTNTTNPDGWDTWDNALLGEGYVSVSPATSVRSTDSVWAGSYSMLLQTKATAISGFGTINLAGYALYKDAYTARPDSLSFATAFLPAGGDTAFFSIQFFKQGTAIGGYPQAGYSSIFINAVHGVYKDRTIWASAEVPDSVSVTFSASLGTDANTGLPAGTAGTKFYVDAFNFYAFEAIDTGSNANSGQCNVPSTTNGASYISAQPETFPCIQQGTVYDQTLQIRLVGAPSGLSIIDSLRIDSITGLPAGITYSISPNNSHLGGSALCINFNGTTSMAEGDYPLAVHGRVYFNSTMSVFGLPSSTTSTDTVSAITFGSNVILNNGSNSFYLTVTNAGNTNCHSPVVAFDAGNYIEVCPYYQTWQTTVSVNGSSTLPANYIYSWNISSSDPAFYADTVFANNSLSVNPSYVSSAGGRIILTVTDTITGISGADTLTVAERGGNWVDYNFDTVNPVRFCVSDNGWNYYDFSSVAVDSIVTPIGDFDAGVFSNSFSIERVGSSLYLYESTYDNCNNSYLTYHSLVDSIAIDTMFVTPQEYLCMVTVDTASGHNKIVWEKQDTLESYAVKNLSAYAILKLNDITSDFDTIGVVPKDSLSEFIDVNSNPAQQSSTYGLGFVQLFACSENYDIYSHTTIHLSSNIGTSGEVNLSWNAYIGFNYTTFDIYRSNNGSAFEQIGNAANSSSSYTDLTPPSGTNRYFVSVTNPSGCTPTRSYSASISNILNPADVTGINDIAANTIKIHPNPANSFITVSGLKTGTEIRITNVIGEVIYSAKTTSETQTIPVANWASGMYFLNNRKFVKE